MFFKKRVKTYIVDGQILGDGRIVPLIEKELFQGKFVLIPQPVYEVIPSNNLSEEAFNTRIEENIERIKKIAPGKTSIITKQLNKSELIKLAKKHNATIITPNNDTKTAIMADITSASAKAIKVIALTELYEILKPGYLPGVEFKVTVTKKGKEHDEGIGYLDGGIKVVVSGGARALGKEMEVVVLGSIETNVGKLIFAKPKYVEVK